MSRAVPPFSLGRAAPAAAAALLVACTGTGLRPAPAAPAPAEASPAAAPPPPAVAETSAAASSAPAKPKAPVAPPELAFRLGLMPLGGTGVTGWRAAHPDADGRGVLIGILDSGVDPSVPGLQTTTTGQPKILDLRNFSGEGDVPLVRVRPGADGRIALPEGLSLAGAEAVRAVAVDTVWYGGVVRELPFGGVPDADFNGNGSNRDRYGVVVVRSAGGWVALIDTNGDGSLAGETATADYLVAHQTFSFGAIAGAVNLSTGPDGAPRLSLVLDTGAHGTHVAGIAAGHDLYGVAGFDGVAPGAQIIALKIADNARGGLSTTGSMIRAMRYAAEFASARRLPLVLNMSYGVGNEEPGAAAMDSLVNEFLAAHPDVVFCISAGNDGPGTATMGLPASADFALTIGAVYPSPFAPVQFGAESPDVLGWWTSRGGELDKPDVVTPGMAYSTVPRWDTGNEIKLGTSMASPHAAGLVALLISALRAEGRTVTAAPVTQALRATARRLGGATAIDEGYGMAQVAGAYAWLEAGHAASRFLVRVEPAPRPPHDVVPGLRRAPVAVVRPGDRPSAAYRRWGFLTPGDTVDRFDVQRMAGPGDGSSPPAYRLVAETRWMRPVAPRVSLGADGAARVEVRYDPALVSRPGRHVGVVDGFAAGDSAAGPAFRLVSDVIVPDTVSWGAVSARSRAIGPGEAWRYYVNVPVGAADLSVRVAIPDTSERGFLYLFEPSGRPSRAKDHADLGGAAGSSSTLSVTAADVRPGVWEAVVQAVPGQKLAFDFDAAVPPVTVAAVDSSAGTAAVTFRSAAAHDTTLSVTAEHIGIVTAWAATVVSGATYRRTLAAPVWARQAVLEVQLAPDLWNQVTDFGLTLYDSAGAQLGQGPMNYDFNRVTVDLPEKHGAGFPVTVELFPAFAHTVPPASFVAHVRLAFVGSLRSLTPTPVPLAIPARAAVRFAIPPFSTLVPESGWADLIRVRAAGMPGDWVALERQVPVGRE